MAPKILTQLPVAKGFLLLTAQNGVLNLYGLKVAMMQPVNLATILLKMLMVHNLEKVLNLRNSILHTIQKC